MENLNNSEDIRELKTQYNFISKKIEEVEELVKDKFCIYDKAIADIESERKLQSFQYNQIMDSLKVINKSMEEIKSKPSKRWDIFLTASITGIATFFIGYLAKIIK